MDISKHSSGEIISDNKLKRAFDYILKTSLY
jgi:hypothetical protein